jgi:transposase-like protein
VSPYRWVQRFTPLLIDGARPCRHAPGDRWFVDGTYVKVAGRWRYVYRAVDQYRQVIDVYVSKKWDTGAATRFFTAALGEHGEPAEVTTDRLRPWPKRSRSCCPRRFTTPSTTAATASRPTMAGSKPASARCGA